MRNKFRNCLNIILISSLSISCWEVGKKQFRYIENQATHKKIITEKEEGIKARGSIQKYLYDKEYDWITVSNTTINYPLILASDNQYYLTHDYTNKYNIAGSIFYDAIDTPYNNNTTIIFGHSMRDGTMFNNLHYFPKDIDRFNKSELVISNKEETKKYKPLGFAIYEGKNPFYRKVDTTDLYTTKTILKENCKYLNDIEITENNHIIALVTCDYSIDGGRLVVFYISE